MSFGWFGCSMNFRRYGRGHEGHPGAEWCAGPSIMYFGVAVIPYRVVRMREESRGLCGRFGRLCRSGAMAPFRAGAIPNVCEGAKPRRAAATCTWPPDASAWLHRRPCCGTCTARAASACSRCSMHVVCNMAVGDDGRVLLSQRLVAGLHSGIVPHGDRDRVHHDSGEVAVGGLLHAAVLFSVAGLVDAGAQA